MPPIDPQTQRRITRLGVTAFDESKACPGYTLFAPMFGGGAVYLIDLQGNEVHKWQLPYPPGLYGYLLPNGNLFYLGKAPDNEFMPFEMWQNYRGGVMAEVTPNGDIVWEHRDQYHHHDARRTDSGGAIYLGIERVPDDLVSQVQGGVAGTDEEGMWVDTIVEVDASGDTVWTWHAYEHLDLDTDRILWNDPRHYWTHGNTISPLDDGRILISFRSLSTIGIINKRTGDFEWKLGYDVLAQQHDPNVLPNGNVLVFDNGPVRSEIPMVYSRVIEVDPSTNEIVWEYTDRPMYNFFSPFISGARRLPNGNTQIAEGFTGRVFQVTPENEVVWEYVVPHFPDGPLGPSNATFRAIHYCPGEIPGFP